MTRNWLRELEQEMLRWQVADRPTSGPIAESFELAIAGAFLKVLATPKPLRDLLDPHLPPDSANRW